MARPVGSSCLEVKELSLLGSSGGLVLARGWPIGSGSLIMNPVELAVLSGGRLGGEGWIHVAKLLRAHGGCLGVRRL